MASLSTPEDWTDGEIVTPAKLNRELHNNVGYLYRPPRVRAKLLNDFTIPNNAVTTIEWDAVEFDTDVMWDAENPERIVTNSSGIYEAVFTFRLPSATYTRVVANVHRETFITDRVGRFELAPQPGEVGFNVYCPPTRVATPPEGDTYYYWVEVYQNSGDDRVLSADLTRFYVQKKAPWSSSLE